MQWQVEMLSQEKTLELIKLAQSGDNSAKEMLVNENSPLIKSVVRWFRDKGVEYDDLYQIGCMGFLKAINRFDENYNVKFSTYVVPMIVGEIKRFMRDDGAIKVSRAMKSLNLKITKFCEDFFAANNKSATTCSNEISTCLTAADKCDSDFSKCSDDSDFDKFFASCSSLATGCTNFISKSRDEIDTIRKSALDATSSNIDAIVTARKNAREQKMSSIKSGCSKNTDFEKCIETVCKNNTIDNCQSDKRIANALCEFHKTACTKIK